MTFSTASRESRVDGAGLEADANSGHDKITPRDLPRPPDPDTSSGRISIEATRLLASLGYKGTSTRVIAEAAGVKQVMFNYCFGTRERLYEEVLRHEGEIMLAVIFGENGDHQSPEEKFIDSPIGTQTTQSVAVDRNDQQRAGFFHLSGNSVWVLPGERHQSWSG